ncbi:uncharacterized protein LOC133779607 [Humulus lupulus]|uniref:uncharacterized protein LOC133779607 n=1 Tax=Humulus lupulus TaxID=3486 RepID=UPI002B4107A6|nr:uncharacterized protein LOC133779607 [Humulus lupulus]
MWNPFSGFQELVHANWNRTVDGTMMYRVVQKLKSLKATLRLINKQGFYDIQATDLEAFHTLTGCQDMLSKDPLNANLIQMEIAARQKYSELHRSYCSFLQQKAKIKWSQEGDANTAFFHASIRERSSQNIIYSITTESGDWVDKPDQVSAAFLEFYQNLLGSRMALRTKVIKRVVHQVGPEISDAILSFLHSGKILKELNTTIMTLIPKSNCPKYMSDYQPIACCNVLYKVATKLICSRLRSILPMLIAQIKEDLLKGDFRSIDYLLQGLQLFSNSSSLFPNQSKSVVYCCGMNESEIQTILDASGYNTTHLPIKYLGIPICIKRISAKDCQILLDKMLARLKCWSSRNISFAGHVILINSALLSIHAYWNQIMIIPVKILKEIFAMCRAFLWSGQAYSTAIGKYVWAIAEKKDNLWVKWVHHVYIKQEDWWNYTAPASSSWYWRKIDEVKRKFKRLILMLQFQKEEYQIRIGYSFIHPALDKVQWTKEFDMLPTDFTLAELEK